MQLEAIPQKTEAEAIAELSAKPLTDEIHGIPFCITPNNMTFRAMNDYMPKPHRKLGTIHLHEVESFIDVVKRQGSLANCNVYLNVDYATQKIEATAIFNDHADGDGPAGWRDHRAEYAPRFTVEWKTWMGYNHKNLPQDALASFLETNITDITTPANSKLPTGAAVLSFVSALQETRKVKYGSTIDLANGMKQIEFIEESSEATKGKLEIFREFAIGIRPFMNGQAYEIRAFLRYRIDRNTGQIVFWYELQRPDRVLEDACQSIVDSIRKNTGMPVVFGTP